MNKNDKASRLRFLLFYYLLQQKHKLTKKAQHHTMLRLRFKDRSKMMNYLSPEVANCQDKKTISCSILKTTVLSNCCDES